MKKLIVALFSLFVFISSNTANSSSTNNVPDEFSITQHWVSLTTSFDIETKTRKLGTLYRKFFSFLLTYEFFDPFDNKMATARSRFFSFTAHFDIYDRNDRLLGTAEEKMFYFFPTFDIYASDSYTKLATASMNFWGTTFTVYDPETDQEMAVMQRSFFRLKNDWDIKITNRTVFDRKNIDFRVLMTVLAFQGDKENWQKDDDDNNLKNIANSTDAGSVVTLDELNLLQKRIAAASKQAGLDHIEQPEPQTLEHIALELENNYKNTRVDNNAAQTNQEKLNQFVNYCLSLVESNDVPDVKKKAILYLLKMRLGR